MAVRRWLHRRGVVRLLNEGYAAGGYESALVRVAVPWERLARWALNDQLRWSSRLIRSERRGRFHWHYQFRRWP